MKIQAIKYKYKFQRSFYKTNQHKITAIGVWNNQPYSWESNNTGKMANKERIDIYANMLPDNEEIYTKNKGYYAELLGIF